MSYGLLGLLLIAGCHDGPEMIPVSGTVVFPDGKPVTGGTIEFETADRKPPVTATGEISETGSFVLGTYSPTDGVLPGKHRVVVVSDYEIGTGKERPDLVPKPNVHSRFRKFESSELEFDIKKGQSPIQVVVDYADHK